MRARLSSAAELVAALAVILALLWAASSVWEPARVTGLSMSPALSPGDLVIVNKSARAREGSIVLVRASGHGAILHRVVAIGRDGALITRGDANPVNDRELVEPRAVAGVVVRVIPVGALLRRWRGVAEVEYHDGSTEQHEAMAETTSSVVRSDPRGIQR